MDNNDIIAIHKDILKLFSERKNQIDQYQTDLKKLIENQNQKISFRIKTKIEEQIKVLTNLISDVKNNTSLNYYLMNSQILINKYTQIINTPIKTSFIGKKIHNTGEKQEIINKYLEISRYHKKNLVHYKPSQLKLSCFNCPNKKLFVIEENNYICAECGAQLKRVENLCSYNAINRVNISSKYTYDRKIHFRDCVNQFQGKQNSVIPDIIYQYLINQLKVHNFVKGEPPFPNITKQQIYMFLKDGKFAKHYEDLNLIHFKITGIKPPDISHIEANILADFDILTNLYDIKFRKNKKYQRKNFINTQYVLYQLLRKYNFPCKSSDFNILKTVECKAFHDEICRELFSELKWNFNALF